MKKVQFKKGADGAYKWFVQFVHEGSLRAITLLSHNGHYWVVYPNDVMQGLELGDDPDLGKQIKTLSKKNPDFADAVQSINEFCKEHLAGKNELAYCVLDTWLDPRLAFERENGYRMVKVWEKKESKVKNNPSIECCAHCANRDENCKTERNGEPKTCTAVGECTEMETKGLDCRVTRTRDAAICDCFKSVGRN